MHMHRHKTTQMHSAQAYARSGLAPQALLAFGWLWHNESTVKTSSRLFATLRISVVSLAHKGRVFTWKEGAGGKIKYRLSKTGRQASFGALVCLFAFP